MNTVFSTPQNGNVGIQKEPDGTYSVWIDPFQEFDFQSIDTEPFQNEDDAKAYLDARYGELTEIFA